MKRFTRRNFERGTLQNLKLARDIQLYFYYDDITCLWFLSAYPEIFIRDSRVKGLEVPSCLIGNRNVNYQILCDYLNYYCFDK